MNNELLAGLRIIEGSAYVAGPLAGLTLAQLGAEVIRFDGIGGGIDFKRWPLAANGESLFWHGLNRGKKSFELNFKDPQGQELLIRLITMPGENSGIFITNFPPHGWMSYENLIKHRPDLIMVVLTGNFDGSSAVDYTVNPSFGFPLLTGPEDLMEPVNSVMPTWDFILGLHASTAILAALNKRNRTGNGEFIRIALSDVALASVGALGRLAQAYFGETLPADGNYLYGAFGRNFTTCDGQELMVVALTARQWNSLKAATSTHQEFEKLEITLGVPLDDEGNRYKHRKAISNIFEKWFASMEFLQVEELFNKHQVAWSRYLTLPQLLASDNRATTENPIFAFSDEVGLGEIPNISSPIRVQNSHNVPISNGSRLGADNEYILNEILNIPNSEIEKLIRNGVLPEQKWIYK